MKAVKPPKLQKGETSQSKFTNYKDLTVNGWAKNPTGERDFKADQIDLQEFPNVQTILKSLKYTPDMKAGANTAVVWKQNKNVYNGKSHQATNGEFMGTFNPKGLIVVALATSPQESLRLQGEQKGLPAAQIQSQISNNMPQLNRLSDILFLEWVEQCRLAKTSPKNIRHILWHNIETPLANHVLDHILKSKNYKPAATGGKGTYEAPPWEKRLELNAGTDEFFAVLGTPNGAANAWLLLQHRGLLGRKRIGRAFVSLDSEREVGSVEYYDGPTVVFEVEDLEGGKGVIKRSGPGSGQPLGPIRGHSANVDDDQRYIRSESQRSSPPSTSSSESGGPSVPNDMTPAAFQNSVTSGKRIYQWMSEPNSDALTEKMIQANTLYPGEKCQSKFTQYEEIASNGWTKNSENSDTRLQVNDIDLEYHAPVHTIVRHYKINSDMKHDNPPGPNVAVMYDQDKTVFNGQEHDRPSFAHLIGTFNPTDGLIVVDQFLTPQEALEDQIREESPGINASDMGLRVRDNIPALSRPSDLIFLQYQQLCAKTQTNPRNLRLAILHSVGKPGTAQVLDYILKSRGAKKAVKPGKGAYEAPVWNNRLTLTPNTDAFNAVLSTPDTAPLVYLLIQHKEQLGLKRIKAIHISLGSKQVPGGPNEYLGSTLTFEFEDMEKGKWIASGSGGGGDRKAGSSKQSEPGSSPEKKKGKFKGKLGKMFGKGKGKEGA